MDYQGNQTPKFSKNQQIIANTELKKESVQQKLKSNYDQFMNLDETGIAKLMAEEREWAKQDKRQLTLSPHRQQLEKTQKPPNSIKVALTSNQKQEDGYLMTQDSTELTDLQIKQKKTEQYIKDRSTSVVQKPSIKIPKKTQNLNDSSSSSDQSHKKIDFNPNKYVTRRQHNFKQDRFREDFYSYMKTNKKQINENLVQLVYAQVENAITKKYELGIPQTFKDNIKHWAGLMIKSKKLQGIFADFNEQIAEVLEYEISHQKQFIKDYLSVPRIEGQNGFSNSPYIPKNLPKTKEALSVYSKAKAKIREIQKKYKKTQEDQTDNMSEEFLRLKDKLERNQKEKLKPDKNAQLLTPIQELLLNHIKAINSQAQLIEVNNQDLQQDVQSAEKDLSDTRAAKQGKDPGKAVQGMLTKWHDEPSWFSHSDLKIYVTELWTTKEKFEEMLAQQTTAMQIELRERKAAFVTRVDSIRANASFRIQALETALLETKIKYKREMERSEMKLAEMESYLMNQQMEKKFIDTTIETAQKLIVSTDNSKQASDNDDFVKVLKTSMNQLLQTIESLKLDITTARQQNVELQGVIEKDKLFNNSTQEEFKKTKEMTIFYQMLVHDIIKRTKVYESSKASPEEKIMFAEILELNEVRLRQENEDAEKLARLDPKKNLQRLGKYCDNMHAIFLALDFKQIFDNYAKAGDERLTLTKGLALELSDIGLIQFNQLQQNAEPMRVEDIVKEQELLITDKSILDPSFQRFVPKLRAPLTYLQGSQALQPIGVVKTDRKVAIHTIIEQMLLPDQERLALIIEKENQEKIKRSKLIDQQRQYLEQQAQIKRVKELEEQGMMEAQHLTVAQKFTKVSVAQDKKKVAEKIVQDQEKRVAEAERKEKSKLRELAEQESKARAEQKRLQNEDAATRKKNQNINKTSNISQSPSPINNDLYAAPKASMFGQKDQKGKQGQKSNGTDVKEQKNAKEVKKTIKGQKDIRKNQIKDNQKSGQFEVRVSNRSHMKEENTLISSLSSKEQLDDVKTQDGALDIEGMLRQQDANIEAKYTLQLQEIETFEKKEFKLSNQEFELFYDTFKQSLGQDMNTKDAMTMYDATNIESFISQVNILQSKYFQNPTDNNNLSARSVTTMHNEIPFTDLIMADVNAEGEFQGLKIRPNLAKVLYMNNKGDNNKIAKLIKTVNYMNRMLVDPENTIEMSKKHSIKDKKHSVVQTDPMEVQIVEKEVFVEVEVVKEVQIAAEVVDEPNKDDVIKNFFDDVRKHCIKVLMREKPDQAGYYSIVWKNQTNEELLKYKLPNVFPEVPEEGIQDEDREDYETLNVLEYFRLLFKTLEHKLEMNVPRLEKEDLNVKKWIWNGDIYKDEEEAPKKTFKNRGNQTPAEWMKKQNDGHESDASKSRLTLSQRAKSYAKIQQKHQVIQTGDDLLESLLVSVEMNKQAQTKLKEQIDQMVGEEISKTIESMELYMDRVVAIKKNQDIFQKTGHEMISAGKSERLKKQIQSFRGTIDDGSRQILNEIAQINVKKKIQNNKAVLKVQQKEKSPNKDKERFPVNSQILLDELPRNYTATFEPNGQTTRYLAVKTANKSINLGNPFKKANYQSDQNYLNVNSGMMGRTISGSMPPNIVKIRLDLSNPSMDDSSNIESIQVQNWLQPARSSRQTNFFTGTTINTDLKRGPIHGEILYNAQPNYLLSPRISKSKRTINSPPKEIISIGPNNLSNSNQMLYKNQMNGNNTAIGFNINSMSTSQTDSFAKGGVYTQQRSVRVVDNAIRETPSTYRINPSSAGYQHSNDQKNKNKSLSSNTNAESEIPSALNVRVFEPTYQRRGYNVDKIKINRNSGEDPDIN